MRLATREEIQVIEQRAASEFGISYESLMDRAGHLMAHEIMRLPGLGLSHRLGVFCGPGNNGGDALVVARVLKEKGFEHVEVWCWPTSKPSSLFEVNLQKFLKTKSPVYQLDADGLRRFDFNKFELLIDGFFGTGLNRPLEEPMVQFIERIHRHNVSVVALDVPSGLNVNTGETWGASIRAIQTLTCGLAKPGFFLNHGPEVTGRIRVLDLGFPPSLTKEVANSTFLIGEASARKLLPPRQPGANKSHFGRLLIVAGSAGMGGAAILAATGAARMGVGYVTICSPDDKVLRQMPSDFLQLSWKALQHQDLKKFSAIVVGPGLGRKAPLKNFLQRGLEEKWPKVLLDADAFYPCIDHRLWPLPEGWLLTPHSGELSRILGSSPEEVERDRIQAAISAQKLTGAHIILKGFHTVLRSQKKSYIIYSGNAALAKAGTGDVLTGFIGSLMAQGLSTDVAAALGVYLHGRIADRWLAKGGSQRTLMASDLPELLHPVLARLE